MKRYQPAIDKFKNAFFDGHDSDNEASFNSKSSAAGRGRGAKRTPSTNNKKRAPSKKADKMPPVAEVNLDKESDDELQVK